MSQGPRRTRLWHTRESVQKTKLPWAICPSALSSLPRAQCWNIKFKSALYIYAPPPPPRPPHSACTKPFPSADTPFQCFPSVIWAKLEATAEDEARETHLRLRRTMRSSLSEGPDRQHSTRNTDLFLQILTRSLFNRLPGEGVLARE